MQLLLNASKKITNQITVAAKVNEIQVLIGDQIEYVWFANNINEARGLWLEAVYKARSLAARIEKFEASQKAA